MNLTAIFSSKGQRRHAAPNEMTSKDYYFDSYAHFGIHEDALTVKKGEELKGVFTCASNARNERDLDFNIKVSFHGGVCDLEKESTYTLH
ncbi:hypothetical protein PRIPAC_95181 [Pristionchus pacificus]|uniref:Uncharacterized protein n=1 Tax=Pristionchus pacificus TaxID=54126 RepID=A0A2A6BJT9_PRIPA|nr:hypothetical protein PRIPAC_95181 [Pristionchus pacificus]|eukprot:PDM66185.1 hypothetical protein PRIPAC_45410 [Pristionchus pacificus]